MLNINFVIWQLLQQSCYPSYAKIIFNNTGCTSMKLYLSMYFMYFMSSLVIPNKLNDICSNFINTFQSNPYSFRCHNCLKITCTLKPIMLLVVYDNHRRLVAVLCTLPLPKRQYGSIFRPCKRALFSLDGIHVQDICLLLVKLTAFAEGVFHRTRILLSIILGDLEAKIHLYKLQKISSVLKDAFHGIVVYTRYITHMTYQ